jgi:hypothetical protein
VEATRSQHHAMHQLAREAESLVRRLAGVAHARVVAGPRGIDAIHVVAHDPQAARGLAANVRSALLAGLATPILPARVHVRLADDARDDDNGRAAPATAAADAARPAHRVRLLDTGNATRERTPGPNGPTRPAAPRPADPAPAGIRAGDRPRLVSVDLEQRPDNRILCRVAIAYDAHVHSAEAVAVDLPGAAAQAAAQATVRALSDAGITGLELNGLREVEIAGREFVIVALRRNDSSRRLRSGSAPVIGSAERSAAEATVAAAHELI